MGVKNITLSERNHMRKTIECSVLLCEMLRKSKSTDTESSYPGVRVGIDDKWHKGLLEVREIILKLDCNV